jgi:hypothetical protein
LTDAPPESFARVRAAMAAFRLQATPAIAAARAHDVDICYDAAPDRLAVLGTLLQRWWAYESGRSERATAGDSTAGHV